MSIGNLIIQGYSEDPSTPNATGDLGTFIASINPENVSLTKSISFNDNNTTNSSGKDTSQNQGSDLDQLSFDLILDGTGLVTSQSVGQQLRNLTQVCCKIDGDTHKPPYLFIVYGDIVFKGHTESLTVDYNLFDTQGYALRAKVSLKFKEFKSPGTEARDNNMNSPDMSHMKVIREGDSLPSMCKDIYGDIKYYIAIARINKLTNFRDIEVGTELLFPPLV